MSIVLDSSMTLSWCFKDERKEASQAVLRQVTEKGALVPPLWRFEVANGLQMGVRRQRIDASYRDETLVDLDALEILVDGDSAAHAWSASVKLADRHRLTIYDAAYLELAQRRRMPLATLDAALLKSGRAEGIQMLGA